MSLIRRETSATVGYSVAELSGARHVFAAAVGRGGATLEERTAHALEAIRAVFDREGARASIVSQSVFVRDAGQVGPCRRIVRDFFGDDLPATTYVPQAACPCVGQDEPCGVSSDHALAVEAWGVGGPSGEVEIRRLSEHLVVATHQGLAWIHCGHVHPGDAAAGVHPRARAAFTRMNDLLAQAGARFDQVVRTWLYLGRIVGRDGPAQRYAELNRARTDFYRDVGLDNHRPGGQVPDGPRRPGYPASTGIGAQGDDVLMSAIALATGRGDVRLVALENPRQTSAFDYAAHHGPQSPKFSRAMAVAAGGAVTIFISGTASITDSQSRHEADVRRQTDETLDNVAALVSRENLVRHGLTGCGATLDDLAQVRVYVKHPADVETVRAVCRARLGAVPALYLVADVCRPELLVEIEGVALAAR